MVIFGVSRNILHVLSLSTVVSLIHLGSQARDRKAWG